MFRRELVFALALPVVRSYLLARTIVSSVADEDVLPSNEYFLCVHLSGSWLSASR